MEEMIMFEEKILDADVPNKNKWQPIETAPKDGTIILVCSATSRTCKIVRMQQWRQNGESKWIPTEDGPFTCHDATHWMPLPTVPNGEINWERLSNGDCPECGGRIHGDGISTVLHCENADDDSYWHAEPDALPVYCKSNE